MFWRVSNYNLRPMEKTNLRILFFLSFFASSFKSDDYNYDDYDEYNYDRNYDYHNPTSVR